jgi:hypothetical protein
MPSREKKAKRHYPPAYVRYNQKKPGIFIRLSKESKDRLDKYRGKMSYGEAIERLLGRVKARGKAREEMEQASEYLDKFDAMIREKRE